VNYHCKPLGKDLDWNGSGMHCNFSTKYMRETGGKEYFESLMAAFAKNLDEHIAVYGPDNHMRLTGLHETQSIDKFTYGIADRGSSVRVPHSFINSGYKGYLEDRRILVGWCELRGDYRHFRTDRISDIEILAAKLPEHRDRLLRRWREQEAQRRAG